MSRDLNLQQVLSLSCSQIMIKISLLKLGIMESMSISARKNLLLVVIQNGRTESELSSLKEPIKFALGQLIKSKVTRKLILLRTKFDWFWNFIPQSLIKIWKRYCSSYLFLSTLTARPIKFFPSTDMEPDTTSTSTTTGTIPFGDSYPQWGWGSTRNLVRCWGGTTSIDTLFRIFTIRVRFRFTPLTGTELFRVQGVNCSGCTLSARVLNCLKSTRSITFHPTSTKQMPLNSNLPFPKDIFP